MKIVLDYYSEYWAGKKWLKDYKNNKDHILLSTIKNNKSNLVECSEY